MALLGSSSSGFFALGSGLGSAGSSSSAAAAAACQATTVSLLFKPNRNLGAHTTGSAEQRQ